MSHGAMIAATATSPRGRTSSSTGSSSPSCRTRWPISPRSAFTPCRPRATTRATSRRTSGPAWRPAIKVHDIGLRLYRNEAGETGFEVLVGGGLGRTPFIGKTIKPFVHGHDLLSYVEAILRVYNQYGRRDNIYKARIKILVHELGIEKLGKEVAEEWLQRRDCALAIDDSVIEDLRSRFTYPAYEKLPQ